MLWVLNLLVFCTAVLLAMVVFSVFFERHSGVAERLKELQQYDGDMGNDEEDELKKPFTERIIRPFLLSLGEKLGNLTPRELRNSIEKKIIYAGSSKNMHFTRFITLQVIFASILFVFPLLLAPFLPGDVGGRIFIVSTLLGLFGFILPLISINAKAARRQLEIQKTLPDLLDLLLVSVEAGLGFDMALKRVTEQAPGTLSREFARTLEEIRMGKSREEALRGIVRRTGVSDLSSFITAVIQSEQLGTNIANTLRVQANTMRQRRRQRAERAAMQAPIKMLFPLIFFIFPTMFVIILGPALIQIMKGLQGML